MLDLATFDIEPVESDASRSIYATFSWRIIVTVEMICGHYGGSPYTVRRLLESMVVAGQLVRWRSRHQRFQSTCYYRASRSKS